jgi:hypothetical protein
MGPDGGLQGQKLRFYWSRGEFGRLWISLQLGEAGVYSPAFDGRAGDGVETAGVSAGLFGAVVIGFGIC